MRRARFSVNKRQRERQREEKRKKKAERREQRKLEEKPGEAAEDPDLAGIVPGPQPKPWDESELPPFELGDEAEGDEAEAGDAEAGDAEEGEPSDDRDRSS